MSNNNNQNTPAASWRFKGPQGATPWKESYAESTLAAELASAAAPPAGAAAAAPALSAAMQDARLTQTSIAQATTTAPGAVQWNLEALQRGRNGVPGDLASTEMASQTDASVQSTRPYGYEAEMDAAQHATSLQHAKPLEWSAAVGGMESTRPYTTDMAAWGMFESTKPMLLSDVTDVAGTTKPLELSPSMRSALEQPLAPVLALEGSAQQLLQAMAGFAPSAMGTAATASATQAALWNQAIAVGVSS
ncbi:hypothetical protein [Acidovorax sp. SUPP3334]|uniref:hypothetical protein n=1 Tax=Acidovorax sp. SUPP3334 TaxID=2920881 RepID=UPI0023DE3F19|nr:hypothetical protein [Acidovorax sp. SUPP3334]GKT21582.1 hypothetical protein AVHM3334_05245 [Acidovorax sp. SUPP3334]